MTAHPQSVPRLPERYRILREIGRGAYGTVYLAVDERHGGEVAVKVLRPSSGRSAWDRFLDEIRFAAKLNHPHILGVHDSGAVDGTPFYVMPFVQGESLRQQLDRTGRLPLQDAIRIVSQIASALGHAHAHGVIHRDIKPDNLLIGADGHLYVADFGVALGLDRAGATRRTDDGSAVGTALYMSPEQCTGERDLDGRADLYSMACVFYEMLTGRAPFTEKSVAALAYAHVHREAPRLRESRADIPLRVDRAVATALAKNRADRPGSCREFAAAVGVPGSGSGGGRRLADWIGSMVSARWLAAAQWTGALTLALLAATVLLWPLMAGSWSVGAVRSYRAGLEALDVWDLPAADSLFALSVALDSSYARAQLRLAQTRHWQGAAVPEWHRHAELAWRSAHRLPEDDRAHAEGLWLLAEGEYPAACGVFTRIVGDGPAGFAGHYGLAECSARDALVVEDASSVTGWSFRSSYWLALQQYQAAFLALPDEITDLRRGAFSRLKATLMVRGNQLRMGRTADGTFLPGHLFWRDVEGSEEADSIAAVPAEPGRSPGPVSENEDAFRYVRPAYVTVAGRWVERFPNSAEAHQAWSFAMEAMGLPDAIEAIRRARELADARHETELAATEAWLLVKHGAPDRIEDLERARDIATGLLDDALALEVLSAVQLSGLAVLTGQPLRAADLAATPEAGASSAADVIERADRTAASLQVLAAAGTEGRVLDSLEATTVGYIVRNDRESDRASRKNELLALAAILAYPDHVSSLFADPDMSWSAVGKAQLAHGRGDVPSARATLDEIATVRADILASMATLDAVYPEARLMAALGDSTRAVRWLGATLDSLRFSAPGHVRDTPARAAVLVPAFIELSRLARADGADATASRWERAAVALWAGGDEVALGTLARLARTP